MEGGDTVSTGFNINPHYPAPSDEVMMRLRQSELEAEMVETRDMKCPICNFWIAKIPVAQTDVVFVKCQKCKFKGVLSPAYFRRMKRHRKKYVPHSSGLRGKR